MWIIYIDARRTNLKNEDIGSINQDQINEYKKKVFENITHNNI